MRLPCCFLTCALWLTPQLASAQSVPSTDGGPATAQPAPAPEPAREVRLHVDGPPSATVFGRHWPYSAWTVVCETPCDALVPVDWQYEVRADGMEPSGTFRLRATAGQGAVVHVDAAYPAWYGAGVAAVVTGVTGTLVGIPLVLLHGIACGFEQGPCSRQTDIEVGVVGAASVALIGLGIFAMARNDTTTVSQREPDAAPASPEPAWRTAERREVPTPPATVGTSLVMLRF